MHDTALYQASWGNTLSRLFPGNWTLGSAGLFVGLATVALVAAAPWTRRLGVRSRVALAILPVASVVSMQVPATQLAWHSFAVPNGSAYREAFVIAGILAVTAWLGLARGVPGRWPLIAGAVTVATIGAVLAPHLSARTLGLSVVTLVLFVAAAALGRARALALVMLAMILAESAYTAGATYLGKANFQGAPTTLSASIYASRRAEVPPVPDGERARVSRSSENDPLLLGYNGIDYYSSTIPQTTTDAFADLGLYYSRRRTAFSNDDPVVQGLLGIHDRAEDRVNALVTVLPAGPAPSDPAAGGTVWAARDELAGTRLYTVPAIRLTDPATGAVTEGRPFVTQVSAAVDVTAQCRAGTTIQVATRSDDRRVGGSITWQNRTVRWGAPQVHTLGTVPADGRVALTIRGDRLDVRPGDVGCLDPAALDRMVTTSRGQDATTKFDKQQVTATWPTPQTGDAVILTTALPGWTCQTDGNPVTPTARAGMLTVPLHDTTNLTCNHHTKGLWPGIAIAAAALGLTVALQTLRTRRDRRKV